MLRVLMQTSEETAFLMSLQSVLSLSLLKFSCNFFLWNALSHSADLFTLACCICFFGTHTRPSSVGSHLFHGNYESTSGWRMCASPAGYPFLHTTLLCSFFSCCWKHQHVKSCLVCMGWHFSSFKRHYPQKSKEQPVGLEAKFFCKLFCCFCFTESLVQEDHCCRVQTHN